jgi:hypothetical protein
MRPYRARFREQGVFFAFQSWVACITNIFDLICDRHSEDKAEIRKRRQNNC